MMRIFIFMATLFVACTSSQYGIVAPRPTIQVVLASTECTLGQTVHGTLSITQEGADGTFSLSALPDSGAATITVDGSTLPMSGSWTSLSSSTAALAITPTEVGELIVSLTAQSADGSVSERYLLRLTVTAAAEITADIDCESKVVNLAAGATVPIAFAFAMEEYTGQYKITASITTGQGDILSPEGNIITDIPIQVDASAALQYRPAQLGDHILGVTVQAGGVSAEFRIYILVVKRLAVECAVSDGYTVAGVGEYTTEGQSVTLSFANDDLYNFEVEGWYGHDGQLLGNDNSYSCRVSLDSEPDFTLRLKQRTVTISRMASTRIDTKYIIQQNGLPVAKTVTDYRTQLLADYKASEQIRFRYESSQYKTSVVPPVVIRSAAAPTFNIGTTRSTYLWRTDNSWSISIRAADNPDLKFNTTGHYIESESTRYVIPSNIAMQ